MPILASQISLASDSCRQSSRNSKSTTLVCAGSDLRRTVIDTLLGDLSERIGNPLIDGFAVVGGCLAQQCVDFWRGPQGQLARIGFLRLRASFLAKGKIVIDAIMKSLHQLVGTFGLERYDVSNAKDAAMKHHVLVVELERPGISLVKSHGLIPTFVRNSRMSLIAQRLVSGDGCGR
ncbi:hypothetical protein MESS4_450004 [Mesorhizobium sp. STM 4661]|nr:hypothetical protein MESS4_450004 [Mesorhizobium sp. STM 4661]